MSLAVTATFVLADWIVKGLANGTYERVGGVIREVATKRIVTWLREQGANNSSGNQLEEFGRSLQITQGILQVTSAVSILNLGVSVIGFVVIAQRLKELEQNGIVEKIVLNSSAGHTEYYLTEKGRRLNKIIFEMFNFALDEVMQNESCSKLKEDSKENLRVCLKMK